MASIRERSTKASGTTWAVLFRHGDRQASKTFRDHKKAKKFAQTVDAIGPDKALAELRGDTRTQGITVDQLAAQYLAWKERDVTPRTMGDYRRDIDNYIKPWFGHRAAESIDETDVQRWVDHMAKTLAPKSVADRHMLLHSIFKYGKARTRNLVTHNPCLETEMPKRTKKPPKGTTTAEWLAICAAAEEKNPDAADLIRFIGSVGYRWSEAAALAVRDVDDDGRDVWVDVTRVFRIFDNRQVLVEDAAKSYAGFRRVRLSRETAQMVRRRLVGKGPQDFVFTNSRGNHWNQNTFLRNTWPSLLSAAKVGTPTRKPTPHWLRHMAVANYAKAGVPMHEIQRIIGHDDIKTTNSTYGGMVSTLSDAALANLDIIQSGRPIGGYDVVEGSVVLELD